MTAKAGEQEMLRCLRSEHKNIAKLLGVVDSELDRFRRSGMLNVRLLGHIAQYSLTYPDLYHHPKEDLLYDRLTRRDAAIRSVVENIIDEHKMIADLSRRFGAAAQRAEITGDGSTSDLAHIAQKFVAAYRHHLRIEEDRLFPAAERSLTRQDWAAIDTEARDAPDPLFGPRVDAAFQPILDAIMGANWSSR